VKEKEADQQSIKMGYGDERQAEYEEEVQEDNMHSTGVASEQSEEPERGAVGGSDVRNDAKAPCVEGRRCLEQSMDCGEEILGDTNATLECQPLLRQTQKDISTTIEVREEEELGRGKQKIRSGGVVEDRTQPVEELKTATPSNSPKRTKEMRIENIGEMSHIRERSRTSERTLQVSNYTSDQPHLRGMDVFNIATLNINGLASKTKVEMLEDFLRREEMDILFLQEFAQSTIDTLLHYKT